MKVLRVMSVMLCFCIHGPDAGAQTGEDDVVRLRNEKIRGILTIQDLRTSHDALLYQFLYDPDTLVRARATLAFGSLQDTAALTDLVNNLSDGPAVVREAAAFAIGQTAQMLSPSGRAALAHDLIWIRCDRLSDPGFLLDEIGKFGDEQALTDIMLKFAGGPERHQDALFMCIARFGIRGISTPGAIAHLLGFLTNDRAPSWKAAYALQRIGNRDEISAETGRLIPLTQNGDPLVRMNIAALFGKLGTDDALIDPLRKLADHDADWRVRVNALKALGNFRPGEETIETFRRAFSHPDLNIALSAVTTFGAMSFPDSGSGELVRRPLAGIERMARNDGREYRWQLQAAAALALARMEGERALDVIRPAGGEEPLLLAGLINAMGTTGARRAFGEILEFTDPNEPLLYRSALEALQEIAAANSGDRGILDSIFAEYIRGLKSADMAVVTVAASNLGDSLFLRPESVIPLMETLGALRAPGDIEAIQEVCRTLGKSGDRRAVPVLEQYLDNRDAAVARAATEALEVLTGENYTGRIVAEREPLRSDLDFEYLEGLPDTISVAVETVYGDIRIDFYKDIAPFTIMNILKLAENEGFYNGLVFHRVVPNFVVQGGDPRGDGWGGPGFSIRSEFSASSYETGAVGIASSGKDTEGSQFFITHSPQPHLDGRYTIVGKVVSGMSVVNEIQVGDRIRAFRRIR